MAENKSSAFIELLTLFIKHLSLILKYKRFMLVFVMVPTLVFAILIKFVIEPYYGSKALIMPPQSSGVSGSLSQMLGDQAGALSSMLGGSLGSDDELNLVWSIFNTRDLHEMAIEKFDFAKIYKFKGKYRADLLKKFRTNFKMDLTDEDMIEISFEDKSPELAKEVVDFLIAKADSIYVVLKTSQAQKSRDFFVGRLQENEKKIDSLETVFAAFQKKYRLFDPKVQFEGALALLSELEIQKAKVDMERSLEQKMRGAGSVRMQELADRSDALQKQIGLAKRGKFGSGTTTVDLSEVSGLSFLYYNMERELRIQLALRTYLQQNVEQLGIEEMKKMQRFTVIQAPWVNNKKTRPPRAPLVLLVFGVFFAAGFLICLTRDAVLLSSSQWPVLQGAWSELKLYLPFSSAHRK